MKMIEKKQALFFPQFNAFVAKPFPYHAKVVAGFLESI